MSRHSYKKNFLPALNLAGASVYCFQVLGSGLLAEYACSTAKGLITDIGKLSFIGIIILRTVQPMRYCIKLTSSRANQLRFFESEWVDAIETAAFLILVAPVYKLKIGVVLPLYPLKMHIENYWQTQTLT